MGNGELEKNQKSLFYVDGYEVSLWNGFSGKGYEIISGKGTG